MSDQHVSPSGYRWAILGAFMFVNLTVQILWICYAPVSGVAAAHYGVDDMHIGLLAMNFMIVYVPTSIPASWAIDRFGFGKAVGFGTILLGAFGILRGFAGNDYRLALFFTAGIALSQPLILNSYTTMAAKWFPLDERASASGMAMAANFIGAAIGLILTPYLVTRFGLEKATLIYGVVAAVSALTFLVVVHGRVPTYDRTTSDKDKALMLDGLKTMLKSRDLWLGAAMFFVGNGVFNGVATFIEEIVRPRGFEMERAGVLGGFLLIGGIFGAAIIPVLSDKYRRRKPFMLIGMICAIPGMLGFIFLHSYGALIASVFALGFFMIGVAPIAFQYAAEITYPLPEGTSNGLLMMVGQTSVVFIVAMELINKWRGSFTPSLIFCTLLMIVNVLLISMLNESKLRD